jgi:hypothetical protein
VAFSCAAACSAQSRGPDCLVLPHPETGPRWNIVVSRSNGLRLLPSRGVVGSTPKAWPETTDVSRVWGKITVVGSVYSEHQDVSLRKRRE